LNFADSSEAEFCLVRRCALLALELELMEARFEANEYRVTRIKGDRYSGETLRVGILETSGGEIGLRQRRPFAKPGTKSLRR
jgi:hypothetical protein